MDLKTKIRYLLLLNFLFIAISSCISTAPGATYSSVEKTEKAREKIAKNKQKAAKKSKKKAQKRYWSMQSRTARRLIKHTYKNRKRQMKGRPEKTMR
ncbi:MAG: hypothetical protein ACPGU5_04920 [Lishizhenia sp.]